MGGPPSGGPPWGVSWLVLLLGESLSGGGVGGSPSGGLPPGRCLLLGGSPSGGLGVPPSWGVSFRGVPPSWGGASFLGGCLLLRGSPGRPPSLGGLLPGGFLPGGASLGDLLLRGASLFGGLPPGGLLVGGVPPSRLSPSCWGASFRDTPLWTESQTRVKT